MLRDNPKLILRVAVILTGTLGLLFFFLVVPNLALEFRGVYPEAAYLFWPGLLCAWVTAVPCYLVLWEFWKVVREIARDNTFSAANAGHLRRISMLVIAVGTLLAAWLVALIALRIPQPGIMLLIGGAITVCAILAMLSFALSHLVKKAAALKAENDLTI